MWERGFRRTSPATQCGRRNGAPLFQRDGSVLDSEAKDAVMLHDMARTGIREVGTENQYRLVRVTFHEIAPRLAALLPVAIEGALPVRMPKLDGMMHQVAGDYRFLAL